MKDKTKNSDSKKIGIKDMDVNRIPGAIVLMIFTVVVTAIVQCLFWGLQSRIEYENDMRETKLQIISELVEESTQINQLWYDIYWNTYHYQYCSLMDESAKDWLTSEDYDYINKMGLHNASYYADLQDDYGEKVKDLVSKYKASVIKSQLYFNISDSEVKGIFDALTKGIVYDFDYIEEQYNTVVINEKNPELAYDKLYALAEKKYQNDFVSLESVYADKLITLLNK